MWLALVATVRSEDWHTTNARLRFELPDLGGGTRGPAVTTCRGRWETTGSTEWLSYDNATAEFSLTEKGRTAGIPTDVGEAHAARAPQRGASERLGE